MGAIFSTAKEPVTTEETKKLKPCEKKTEKEKQNPLLIPILQRATN